MKMDNLLEKYPSFFPPSFNFECGDGWYNILDRFFKMLALQHFEVKMTQIKEKYGDLRIYAGYGNNDIENQLISNLIHEAEQASRTTCEICGNKGSITKTAGWYRCRCRHCKIMDKFAEVRI